MDNKNENIKMIGDLINLVKRLNYLGQMPYEYLKGEKLYPAEVNTIGVIGHYSELNQMELALKMGVTKGAVSRMTKRLEQKGLIVKRQMPNNRKERCLSLTESGQQIFSYHERFHENMDSAILKQFESLSEEEKTGIKKLLLIADDILGDAPADSD